ncbi:MAG: ribosomal protein S18-alanine N-acetyltransferase [Candidatus Thorarchaeota archaeon]|nr:MAG: ribosomal protein S18-alanine N-acetyltransferase [Candidatus Thorarchaeota archaeon]
MVTVEIRPIRLKDLDDVTDIEQRSFPEPWDSDIFDTFACWDGEVPLAEKNLGLMRVATENDRVVGYVVWMIPNDRAKGHIMNIAVREECRRRGIGSLLLRHVFNELAKVDIPICILEVRTSNDAAKHLYEHVGMSLVDRKENYYDDEDADIYSIRF